MHFYENKTNQQLLMQIALTGALYGLKDAVEQICNHTEKHPAHIGPSLLARGIACVSVKEYDKALTIFNFLIQHEEFKQWHEEAYSFKALAHQFKGDKALAQEAFSHASPAFAQKAVTP